MFSNVKVTAATEEAWGRLVRSWVLGKSEFPGVGIDKLPLPRTLAELKAQCDLVGVQITIPASITDLVMIQPGPNTLVLRLPSKKMTEDALAAMGPGTYQIPHFYTIFCGPLNVPAGKEEAFQALRIGDYSIGNCN